MKLFKKVKKGFTLIELVVVIAVVAILAAISVISYLSITNKAKESHDNQIIDQVNLSLKADETLNGKPKTMHRALEALKEDGFLPANFGDLRGTAKDYTFAYSLKENKFVALKGGKISYPSGVGEHANHELWKIAESTTGLNDGYSYYLRGEDKTGSVNVTAGFDAGDNTGITEINYSNPSGNHNAVIRTNGGALNINAPEDTVKHFGNASVVTLTAVGSSSYYEHGAVNLVDVKKGRLVITNDKEAEVGTIYLTATNNGYDGIILATQNGSELPDVVARESVDLPTSGEKLVVTIQTNVNEEGKNPAKTEEIYLYPASDVKEGTNGYDVSDLGLLVVEALSPAGQAQAEEQLAGKGQDIIDSVKEEKTADLEDVETAAVMFSGGTGTQAKPYLISKADEWNNMYLIMKKAHDEIGADYSTIYFALKNNIDLNGYGIDIADGWDYYNHMSFDGNGFTVSNINTCANYGPDDDTFVLWPRLERSTIMNVTFNYAMKDESRWGFGMCYVPRDNTHFTNVKTTGYIESSTAAWISTFGMYPGSGTTYYKNCSNEANLVGFFGNDCYITPFGSHCGASGAKVSFEKCTNYGSISGGDAGGFVGMGNADHFIFVGDDAAINYGEINGAKKAGHFQYGSSASTFTATGSGSSKTNTVSGNGSKINTIASFVTSAPANYGEYLSFDSVESATSYKVRITVAVQRYNYDDGSNKDKWSGGFPVTVYNQLVDSNVVNSAFMKAYVYESNNTKKDCRTDAVCEYEGLYAPQGFNVNNAEILLEDNGFYLVKYNNNYFYYLNLGEHEGLLTTDMQQDNSKTLAVSFDIVAYNQKGSVLGTSSCSYNFRISEAKAAQ